MTYAARVAGAVFPVAELLGYDLAERTGYGLLLTTRMPGTSMVPPVPDPERLRALGAAAARINSIELAPAPALPLRSRPIQVDDFAGMRREQGASDLLRAAEAATPRSASYQRRAEALMASQSRITGGSALSKNGPGARWCRCVAWCQCVR
jgi:Phosphotransferase enzyme family